MSIHAHPARRRALAAATAGACLAAMLGLAAASASAAPSRVHARVLAGTLEITGTARADTIAAATGAGATRCW